MTWETEEERLRILAEVLEEQARPAVPFHRKFTSSIRIDEDGRIQPIHRPQRIKAEGIPRRISIKPAKPEDKRPKGQRKPIRSTAVSDAIHSYLDRTDPKSIQAAPEKASLIKQAVARTNQTALPTPTPAQILRKPARTAVMSKEDQQALLWLKQMGHR